MLFGEEGGESVARRLANAAISTVNWAEVAQRVLVETTRRGSPLGTIDAARVRFEAVGLTIAPFERIDAEQAALLREATRDLGLSLGDRACLALAQRLGVPALTADRVWRELPGRDLGLRVEVVR